MKIILRISITKWQKEKETPYEDYRLKKPQSIEKTEKEQKDTNIFQK